MVLYDVITCIYYRLFSKKISVKRLVNNNTLSYKTAQVSIWQVTQQNKNPATLAKDEESLASLTLVFEDAQCFNSISEPSSEI